MELFEGLVRIIEGNKCVYCYGNNLKREKYCFILSGVGWFKVFRELKIEVSGKCCSVCWVFWGLFY